MDFLLDILSFVIKFSICGFSAIVVVGAVFNLIKDKSTSSAKITFNDRFDNEEGHEHSLDKVLLSKKEFESKKRQLKGTEVEKHRKSLFVLDFIGDTEASESEFLAKEIDAIILNAKEEDEVLINLESGGGTVNGYGYLASLIGRLKSSEINVTICVDKVAASGGYLAACVADELYAADFAYIGSIGVIAEIPNVHELLKSKGVEVIQATAGENKRNVTLTNKINPENTRKLEQELEEIHEVFKDHILKFRPEVDIEKVSSGDVWLGKKAKELKLIDGVMISDDVIDNKRVENFNIIDVVYEPPKTPNHVFGKLVKGCVQTGIKEVLRKVQDAKTPY